MKYFIGTEFHEYHKQVKMCGILVGKPIPTVDFISIGIVSEDNREYYAISKDFNIKDAWNSYQIIMRDDKPNEPIPRKEYWLRENVLRPIYTEFWKKEYMPIPKYEFTYKNLKKLINKYGKTNKEIAEDIKELYYKEKDSATNKFYCYYKNNDWIILSRLLTKVIDTGIGFPIYLKQMLDEKQCFFQQYIYKDIPHGDIRNDKNYPKQTNKHNALADAIFNKNLYKFLKKV